MMILKSKGVITLLFNKGSLGHLLSKEKDAALMEGTINSLIVHLVKRMCTPLENGNFFGFSLVYMQHYRSISGGSRLYYASIVHGFALMIYWHYGFNIDSEVQSLHLWQKHVIHVYCKISFPRIVRVSSMYWCYGKGPCRIKWSMTLRWTPLIIISQDIVGK